MPWMAAGKTTTSGTGRDSSIAAGANSAPSHSVMRPILDVCLRLVSCVDWGNRDSVERTPTVTMSKAITINTARPMAVAMEFAGGAADRTNLNKTGSSAGIRNSTLTWIDSIPIGDGRQRHPQPVMLIRKHFTDRPQPSGGAPRNFSCREGLQSHEGRAASYHESVSKTAQRRLAVPLSIPVCEGPLYER